MSLTAKVVLIVIIFLGVYDLYAVSTGGIASTISCYMKESGVDAPFIVFTVGYICGHIFGFFNIECPVCRRNKDNQTKFGNKIT